MLIENLYTLDSYTHEGNKIIAIITINATHKIFAGHFPGQPVLPGVCQLQIVKEMLERGVGKPLLLSEAGVCKFLRMIDPEKTNLLTVTIDYNASAADIGCNAVISSGEVVYLKMNGNFKVLSLS
ncbi:3-hydroxyacyl-ACP dehydratase [Niabella digestorum]|jgi:3-hydroxymyristoyl/3-hydroxydecanoyl-(acyl carrier protein) dehydratases|uniref:3-hydroxyacyl-ACP dehydratase n=1 Tax=Niabella digestorum TaxID=3117701 RepID=A0ABU7RHB8_9BACT